MRKDDITDFIQKQEKISKRNFMNYQESGVSRYYRAHDRAEMLIDLARQALSAADDHEMVGIFRSELADFGNRAMSALHENKADDADVVTLLKDIKSAAIMRGLITDPWR